MVKLVCNCCSVTEQSVLRAIRSGARSITAIGEVSEAGTGCRSCHAALRNMLAKEARACPIAPAQLDLFSSRPKRGG